MIPVELYADDLTPTSSSLHPMGTFSWFLFTLMSYNDFRFDCVIVNTFHPTFAPCPTCLVIRFNTVTSNDLHYSTQVNSFPLLRKSKVPPGVRTHHSHICNKKEKHLNSSPRSS